MPSDRWWRPDNVADDLGVLLERLKRGQSMKAGFPGAEDIDYSPLLPFFAYELNNIGDPEHDPTFDHHTKPYEREAIEFYADLLAAPTNDRWGYVTGGSTECLQYGLLRARRYYPQGVAYYSEAAHYKVPRVLADLAMPAVQVPCTETGEMSCMDLDRLVGQRRDVPVIVLATAGTTMTEAVDDVGEINRVLDDHGVLDRYVHVDGALSAIPLALLPDEVKPSFDFTAGADSIGFSLHKFLATRMPGGVVIERGSPASGVRRIPYTGAADTTVTASRNGHLALMAWYAARTLGVEGLRQRAEEARETAAYLVRRLSEIAWPAWRNRHAFTVVLKTPPWRVATGWHLATEDNGWSHYVCLPGRGTDQVDRFIDDLVAEILREESADPNMPVSPAFAPTAGEALIGSTGVGEPVGPPAALPGPACRGTG